MIKNIIKLIQYNLLPVIYKGNCKEISDNDWLKIMQIAEEN